MDFNVTHKCRFPYDLIFAAKQLDAELANRLLANQQLLKDAEDSTPGLDTLLDEGNAILESFFTKNDASPEQRPTSEQSKLVSPDGSPTVDNKPSSSYDTSSSLKSTQDVVDTFGLLPDKSTEEQDEKFLTNAGIILFNNVVYLPGKQSGNPLYYDNIKILRRLYFSLDSNLAKTRDILKNNTKTTFVNTKLVLKVIPPKKPNVAYTVEELRTLLKLDYLTVDDFVVTPSFQCIVLLKTFLALDKQKAETLKNTGIASEELIGNVFHITDIDNSSSAIARYAYLGYKDEELSSILAGEDLVNNDPSTITTNIDNTKALVNKWISYIDFVVGRYRSFTPSNLRNSFNLLKTAITDITKKHKRSMTLNLFQVSTIRQKDIIDLLSSKHSDEKIEYLLQKRLDIDDIWFNPPDDELMNALKRSMDSAPPGSTYMSNKAINNIKISKISQKELLYMYSYLYVADDIIQNTRLNKKDFLSIRQQLVNFLARDPYSQSSLQQINPYAGTVLQGQPSAATPAGILTERMDVMKTLNFEEKKQAVKDSFQELFGIYPPEIAGPLSEIIDIVTSLFEKVLKAINLLVEQAKKLLLALKKRLDAFISKYLTLTGNASFEKSILKCAINWDIGLSTDILDRLFDFFFRFISQVLEFLAKLKKWIADLITKLLCFPVDILNNFLGKVQVSLPVACKIPRFSLGKQLETSLNNLKNVSTTQNFILQTFGRDIAKLRVNVSASTDKLQQFKASSNCSSAAGSNFMNASMLNVGVGIR